MSVDQGMTSESRRRAELGRFLRTRRARLSPAAAGLAPGDRRRTPGLRREEVALLANVSASWYTSLEQGRDVRPSDDVLRGIAQALSLSTAEEEHLFLLTGHGSWSRPPTRSGLPSSVLVQVLDDLRTSPAYAKNRQADLVHYNAAADAVFGLSRPSVPPHAQNLLWRMFVDPYWRSSRIDWEAQAQTMLARVRASAARCAGEEGFDALVADLQRESAEFRRWWPQYDLRAQVDERIEMDLPLVGRLTLQHTTLRARAVEDLQVMIYTPAGVEDAIRLRAAVEATPRI